MTFSTSTIGYISSGGFTAGRRPLICVGETAEEKQYLVSAAMIERQIKISLDHVQRLPGSGQADWLEELFTHLATNSEDKAKGSLGIAGVDTQIWGCERAYARSHPQIWPTSRRIPESQAKAG